MKQMRVLVACEESQAVCIEFRKRGHEAYSCDLQACSGGHPEWHIIGDALEIVYGSHWDLLIGHPPCTYISYAGTRHWDKPGRVYKRLEALKFFAQLWEAPIERICLENPKSCASPVISKYSQEIQPYYFGDRELKTTWLWLRGLPKLKYTLKPTMFEDQTATEKPEPTYIASDGKKIYFTEAITGHDGSELTESAVSRSKTFPGIARAMAEQWSPNLNEKL